MRIWTSTDFAGVWPVGSAAVVVAPSEERAKELLDIELRTRGLRFDGTLEELALADERAVILLDGDY